MRPALLPPPLPLPLLLFLLHGGCPPCNAQQEYGTSNYPPLELNLLCSACEVTVKEIHVRATDVDPSVTIQTSMSVGTSRRTNLRKSELFATEVLENACNGLDKKYKVAQENWGGHFKIFCYEQDPTDQRTCEAPDWYSDVDGDGTTADSRYYGANARLPIRCKEIIGENDEELTTMIMNGESALDMYKEFCEKDCYGKKVLKFRKAEREKRFDWRKRNGKYKAKKHWKKKKIGSAAKKIAKADPAPAAEVLKEEVVDPVSRVEQIDRRMGQPLDQGRRPELDDGHDEAQATKDQSTEHKSPRQSQTYKEFAEEERERKEREKRDHEEQLRMWKERRSAQGLPDDESDLRQRERILAIRRARQREQDEEAARYSADADDEDDDEDE